VIVCLIVGISNDLPASCGWFGVVSVLQAEAACNTDITPTQPATPELQHKSNQEQYDQCGNSTD